MNCSKRTIMDDNSKRFDVFARRQALINARKESNWYLLDLVTLAALVGTIVAIVLHELWM